MIILFYLYFTVASSLPRQLSPRLYAIVCSLQRMDSRRGCPVTDMTDPGRLGVGPAQLTCPVAFSRSTNKPIIATTSRFPATSDLGRRRAN